MELKCKPSGEGIASATAATGKKTANKVLADTRVESKGQWGKCEPPPATPMEHHQDGERSWPCLSPKGSSSRYSQWRKRYFRDAQGDQGRSLTHYGMMSVLLVICGRFLWLQIIHAGSVNQRGNLSKGYSVAHRTERVDS